MKDQDTSARIRPGEVAWVMIHRVLRKVRVVNVTPRYVYFCYYKRGVGYTQGKVRREVLSADLCKSSSSLEPRGSADLSQLSSQT